MAASFRRMALSSGTLLRYIRHDIHFKETVRFTNSSPATRVEEQLNPNNYVKKKFADLMRWYEEVTGMDEVRFAQNRVLDAEQNFIAAQERRRESSKEVAAIQAKLKELYGELDTTSRGEERYVQIITQEHRVLKEERRLLEEFQRYEREERDYFSSLSTAVKDSHEKERAQAEKTKYWSIIGSIIGTVIGIAGSSINNEIKMKQLRRLVQESLVNNANNNISTTVPDALSKHEKELSVIVNQMKTVTAQPNDHILGRLDKLIHTINNTTLIKDSDTPMKQVIDTLKTQAENTSQGFSELKAMLTSNYSVQQLESDQIVVMPIGLEDRLGEQNRELRYWLFFTTFIAVSATLMMKYT